MSIIDLNPSLEGIVACESTVAVVLHARLVTPEMPVRLGGHVSPRPRALCDTEVWWDTQRPVTNRTITCRSCRVAIGWSERMEVRR